MPEVTKLSFWAKKRYANTYLPLHLPGYFLVMENHWPAFSRKTVCRMTMIHIVTPENDFFYRKEMEQAFRLRHHQGLVKQMGWNNLPDEREIDQFDEAYGAYALYRAGGGVDSGARCNGSMRSGFARLCQVL